MSVVINGSAGVTTNSGAVYNGIASGTAVASTSGTSIDFTSIPSWVKRITVMFNGVSLSGSSSYLIQLGSGSVTTSGYVSSSVFSYTSAGISVSSTAGLAVLSNAASYSYSGSLSISLLTGNTWVENHAFGNSSVTVGSISGGGTIALGGTLDRVRITTVNGTDTFDAGSINILYE